MKIKCVFQSMFYIDYGIYFCCGFGAGDFKVRTNQNQILRRSNFASWKH